MPGRRGDPDRPKRPGNGLRSFGAGNTAAVKSGAYSPRVRNEFAALLFEWATKHSADGLKYLEHDSFAPAVWRWADRTAHSDLLYEQLMAHHAADDRPCPGCAVCVSLEARWQKADRTAERAGEALGLDPASRASLLVSLRTAGVIQTDVTRVEGMLDRLGTALGVGNLDAQPGELAPPPGVDFGGVE